MDSNSIIMVAYYFPPEGNAAVYRPLRFLRGLVNKGWRATVISCEPYKYERHDLKLLDQVPSTVPIVRVRERDPWQALQAWRNMRLGEKLASSSADEARRVVAGQYSPWRSWFREFVRLVEASVYRPDQVMSWIGPTARRTIAACQENRPDVLWATIGPLSSGVVAYRASMATGVPYVLDFRDPWGLGYYPQERKRPAWAKRSDDRIIAEMFAGARSVVFLFESVAESYLRAFPGALDKAKVHVIPNGFDGEVEPFTNPPGECCTVLYAGTLASYRYDTLLEGLVQLKRHDPVRTGPLMASRVEVQPGVYVLFAADRVVHCCLHLLQEGEPKKLLRDLLDLHLLLQQHYPTESSREGLASRAEQLGVGAHVATATEVARGLFQPGGRVPSDWLQRSILRSAREANGASPSVWGVASDTLVLAYSHWMKMPMRLLLPHLLRKSWLRLRPENTGRA